MERNILSWTWSWFLWRRAVTAADSIVISPEVPSFFSRKISSETTGLFKKLDSYRVIELKKKLDWDQAEIYFFIVDMVCDFIPDYIAEYELNNICSQIFPDKNNYHSVLYKLRLFKPQINVGNYFWRKFHHRCLNGGALNTPLIWPNASN